MSHIPQCSRPFADRLAIKAIVGRAANNGAKRVRVLVEWMIGKFERVPQQSVGSSAHSVMLNDCEDRFQVAVDRVSPTTSLKIAPGATDVPEP